MLTVCGLDDTCFVSVWTAATIQGKVVEVVLASGLFTGSCQLKLSVLVQMVLLCGWDFESFVCLGFCVSKNLLLNSKVVPVLE